MKKEIEVGQAEESGGEEIGGGSKSDEGKGAANPDGERTVERVDEDLSD